MKTKNEEEKYYTAEEIAKIFRVTPRTIVNMLNSGSLGGFKVGPSWRISQTNLDKYLEKNSHTLKES